MIAFDSNILVYAQEQGDDLRHRQSIELLYRAAVGGAVIPIQVLGEFLNVCIRKLGIAPVDAIDQIEEYLGIFDCPATVPDDLFGAVHRQSEQKLQFFDALILTIAARAGAVLLLSEDMQDGWEIEGLRVLNPFNPANAAEIETMLA